ncbi:MAG: hypothetical protein H0U21_12670, partial [Acidimicrobiia bacterium]|nr:hypothetical protein [Acidimicrobiia bacterium]
MSDDMWRRRERSADDTSEFGGPLFPDDPAGAGTDAPGPTDDTGERRLRFGPNDSGALPPWTDPPTGEVPRLPPSAAGPADDDDDVDVWSTFESQSPVWREDVSADGAAAGGDRSGGVDRDATGEVRADALSEPIARRTGEHSVPTARPQQGRITIGTDPSG